MLRGLLSLLVATTLWLPSIRILFPIETNDYRQVDKIAPKAKMLAERHLALWRDPVLRQKELRQMQALNPEWDFMSRTYFVLALANMALHDEAYTDIACEIIDSIIENTLSIEEEKGHEYFLLGYAKRDDWIMNPPRSHFIDGEITMMMAARRFIRENQDYKLLMQQRVEIMVARMKKSPVGSAESYPNECWLFCNTVSLAAIRMTDALDGSNHSEFTNQWVNTAKEKLSNKATGLLISSYGVDGSPAPTGRCPEGSSIFMSAHMLEVVDQKFATQQYQIAKQALAGSFLGFGYAKEWPEACVGTPDLDSGPIVPFLQASAASSGMAILGAAAFNDEVYLKQLLRSLDMMGFPTEENGQLLYRASNPVGDAVMLYGMVEGPLWDRVMEKLQ